MKNEKKAKLITHYMGKKPKDFVQIDAFLTDGRDSEMTPDEDGDWISWGMRTELMSGSHARVLMPMDADASAASRQLRKMADIVESQGKLFFSDGSALGDLLVFRDSLKDLSTRPLLSRKDTGARLAAIAEGIETIIAKLAMTKTQSNHDLSW